MIKSQEDICISIAIQISPPSIKIDVFVIMFEDGLLNEKMCAYSRLKCGFVII